MAFLNAVLVALLCAFYFFLNWNPETFFRQEKIVIVKQDTEQGGTKDFTGAAALLWFVLALGLTFVINLVGSFQRR